MTGDGPRISCIPYVDAEHWNADFNDQLYLFKASPASWTHLQVRKTDVLREIRFDGRQKPQAPAYSSGAPGRPTSIHLVRAEFEARHLRRETAASITLEASALAEWLRKEHPGASPLTSKTIKNQLSGDFRKLGTRAQK